MNYIINIDDKNVLNVKKNYDVFAIISRLLKRKNSKCQ